MKKPVNRRFSSPQSGNSGGGYPRASLELSEDEDFSQQAVNRENMLKEIVEVVAKKEKEREAKKERVLAEFSQAILSREDQMKQEKAAKIKAEQAAKIKAEQAAKIKAEQDAKDKQHTEVKQQVSGIIDKMTDALSNEVGQLSKNFISRGFFAYEIRTKQAKLAVLTALKAVLSSKESLESNFNFEAKWKEVCGLAQPPVTADTVKRAFRSVKSSRTKEMLVAVEKAFKVNLLDSLRSQEKGSSIKGPGV